MWLIFLPSHFVASATFFPPVAAVLPAAWKFGLQIAAGATISAGIALCLGFLVQHWSRP